MAKGKSIKKAPTNKAAMPKWEKPDEDLVEKFYAALPEDPYVERKKMFGLPCAFVQGNMATGIFGNNIFVRFGEAGKEEWIKNKGACPFEPAPGRLMKEYIVLPPSIVESPKELKTVIRDSIQYVLGLKPKVKKK